MKKGKLFPSPWTDCLYSSDFCSDQNGLGASEQSKHICLRRLLNYLAPNHLMPPGEYLSALRTSDVYEALAFRLHVSLWDTVGGMVVRVTSDIWTRCQPEPLVFAAPYWGSFTSDGEENIPRYWLSPKNSTSLGSHLMWSSIWTEQRGRLLAYFAQPVCWLYCNWRQLQPGGGMTACCFLHIYCFACCFNLILYFLIEEDKTNKNYLTSIAKSTCQLQVLLQKR